MISGVNYFIDSISIARSCCHRYFENSDCNSIEIKRTEKYKGYTSQSGESIRHSDMRRSLTFDPSNFQELSIFFSSCAAAFNQISKVWML